MISRPPRPTRPTVVVGVGVGIKTGKTFLLGLKKHFFLKRTEQNTFTYRMPAGTAVRACFLVWRVVSLVLCLWCCLVVGGALDRGAAAAVSALDRGAAAAAASPRSTGCGRGGEPSIERLRRG